jgi:hypothetical protein
MRLSPQLLVGGRVQANLMAAFPKDKSAADERLRQWLCVCRQARGPEST